MAKRPNRITARINDRTSVSPATDAGLDQLCWMLCAELQIIGDRNLGRTTKPTAAEFLGYHLLGRYAPARLARLESPF